MTQAVRIEPAERRVIVEGRTVRLRAKSFDVLALLASRPGALFPKAVLLERVWEGRAVSEDVLTGCIRDIRRALGDDARAPAYVETVAGKGYRLTASISMAAAPARAPEPGAPGERPSVAVMPMRATDPALSPMAEAFSRDISVGLARTRWLSVASSASAERVRGRVDAAGALGVHYLVEGDLRRSGNRLAWQGTLAEARGGRILWADRIEGSCGGLAEMMAEIGAVVVASVESEIEVAERRLAILSPIRGLDPWMGFHRAMTLLQKQDKERLDVTRQILREAGRADPACARVAAARSWTHWQRAFFRVCANRDTAIRRARDYAGESIALDPRDPLGYWVLGRAEMLANDFESASRNLSRAVTLNPSFAVGHYSYGYTLFLLGHRTMAMEHLAAAVRLSPFDPLAFAFHLVKGHLHAMEGDHAQALYHAREVAAHPNVHAFGLAGAAWVLELSGDRKSAERCVAALKRRAPDFDRSDYLGAWVHQSPDYPVDHRRAIERAFDRLGI